MLFSAILQDGESEVSSEIELSACKNVWFAFEEIWRYCVKKQDKNKKTNDTTTIRILFIVCFLGCVRFL